MCIAVPTGHKGFSLPFSFHQGFHFHYQAMLYNPNNYLNSKVRGSPATKFAPLKAKQESVKPIGFLRILLRKYM